MKTLLVNSMAMTVTTKIVNRILLYWSQEKRHQERALQMYRAVLRNDPRNMWAANGIGKLFEKISGEAQNARLANGCHK